jgi:hypothetical protein
LLSIPEEVQGLDTSEVLTKRTRSGKAAASSTQVASEQPQVSKKKKKTVIRKIKESPYVTQEEVGVEAATGLVTREIKRKKAKDATALQKALEIAKEVEIPASSLARADVAADAEEVVKTTEDL